MSLTQDSLALLLLCSQIGLEKDSVKALTLREWNPIARKLQAISLRPSDLFANSIDDLSFDLSSGERGRLEFLLSRDIQPELDRLSSHGIFPLTRVDSDYPRHYRQRLKESAPTVLFYAGEKALLDQPGIAVVGSRHLDEVGTKVALFIGNACGNSGQVLFSGGARGVDDISMNSALESRGTAVAVLAQSLELTIKKYRNALTRGDLCLITPYSPDAGFSVGAAMGRNRLIYTLADYAIVVASDIESGGTWAGAIQTINNNWIPLFVLEHDAMPEGNKALIKKGAIPFPHPFKGSPTSLPDWMKEQISNLPSQPRQPSLI